MGTETQLDRKGLIMKVTKYTYNVYSQETPTSMDGTPKKREDGTIEQYYFAKLVPQGSVVASNSREAMKMAKERVRNPMLVRN